EPMTTVAVDLVVEERGGSFRVVAQPKLDTDGGISAGGVNVRFYCVFALGCVVFEKRYLVHVWRCVVESSEHPPSLRCNGAMTLNKKNCELRAARSAPMLDGNPTFPVVGPFECSVTFTLSFAVRRSPPSITQQRRRRDDGRIEGPRAYTACGIGRTSAEVICTKRSIQTAW